MVLTALSKIPSVTFGRSSNIGAEGHVPSQSIRGKRRGIFRGWG